MDVVKLNDWLTMTEAQRYDICKSNDSCKGCAWFCECQAEMTALVVARISNK